MADSFIGCHVALSLLSGVRLDGCVAHIDPLTQQMTLREVTIYFPGQQQPHQTPIYGVVGKDIADLEILANPPAINIPSNKTQTTASPPARQPPPPTTSQSSTTFVEHTQNGHVSPILDQLLLDSPRASRSPVAPRSRAKPKPSKSTSAATDRRRNRQRQPEANDWAGEDVKEYLQEEFDFQANLDMFDKAKVFAEIRESDQTDADTLLVSINRLPKKINLLPSENVLERRISQPNESMGDESDNASNSPCPHPVPTRPVSAKKITIATAEDKCVCPIVSPLQMAHAEHECVAVMGIDEDLFIENGGRGLCQLALKVSSHRQADGPLHFVILANNGKNGAYGLCAARHLRNHGHRVSVCLASGDVKMADVTQRQWHIAQAMGSHLHHGIQGLQQIGQGDMIIDAMLGAETKLTDLQDERSTYLSICDMMQWVNDQAAPVLSVDFPSGVDAGTGHPQHPMHYIQPTWTACLAAPKTGCISSRVTGELYMIDLGYPRQCWKRAGLKKATFPWGTQFVVGLTYL
ncbi:YjeF N-terminal domain-like protein [Hesseltinella vesiculosa]|uniref:Enhancer of mRNA-decapping protein 3 n=1 Tax=Hesseltinella vesiculosa TaxID=101127 RepID=A0A1X2GFC5_9FUNG|nr:YjeF N-terminal domain-like protein [Hesseltinella vesiculosa]